MKKKFYAPYPEDASSYYRASGVLVYLGFEQVRIVEGSLPWTELIDTEVLLIQRPTEEVFEGVIRMAQVMGVKVILDYDDDVLNVDMFNPSYEHHAEKRETIQRLLGLADEVWCSTQPIADSLGQFAKKTVVIPNAHNDYLFPIGDARPYNEGSKVAYWRGGMTHEADMYERGASVAEMVNSNSNWDYHFIGHRFTWLERQCGDNYKIVPDMHLMAYFAYLHGLGAELCFYPLCNTPLNTAKSNIAWIEATYAGAAFMGDAWRYPEGCVADWGVQVTSQHHEQSWAYIQEHLLLSQVNELRRERL